MIRRSHRHHTASAHMIAHRVACPNSRSLISPEWKSSLMEPRPEQVDHASHLRCPGRGRSALFKVVRIETAGQELLALAGNFIVARAVLYRRREFITFIGRRGGCVAARGAGAAAGDAGGRFPRRPISSALRALCCCGSSRLEAQRYSIATFWWSI
jgi:hypothetical protein